MWQNHGHIKFMLSAFFAAMTVVQGQLGPLDGPQGVWHSGEALAQQGGLSDVLPDTTGHLSGYYHVYEQGVLGLSDVETAESLRAVLRKAKLRSAKSWAVLSLMTMPPSAELLPLSERPSELAFTKDPTEFGSVFCERFLERQKGLLRQVMSDLPGLTGVVLDISYPDSELYAFSGTSRQAYIAKAGIDPLDLVGPRVLDSGGPLAPKEDIDALKSFLAWREARVLAFAKECVQIVRESRLECGLLLDALRYQQSLSHQRSSAQPWAEWLKELPDCRAVFSMHLLTSEKMPLAQEALRAIQTLNFKRPPAYLLGAYLSPEDREALGRALSQDKSEIIEVRR